MENVGSSEQYILREPSQSCERELFFPEWFSAELLLRLQSKVPRARQFILSCVQSPPLKRETFTSQSQSEKFSRYRLLGIAGEHDRHSWTFSIVMFIFIILQNFSNYFQFYFGHPSKYWPRKKLCWLYKKGFVFVGKKIEIFMSGHSQWGETSRKVV